MKYHLHIQNFRHSKHDTLRRGFAEMPAIATREEILTACAQSVGLTLQINAEGNAEVFEKPPFGTIELWCIA